MIRRWSRLITSYKNISSTIQLWSLYRLVKKITRFKRFLRGMTRFRRRGWYKLKSRRNWAYLHYTWGSGLKFIQIYRSLYRYQYYCGILSLNYEVFVSSLTPHSSYAFSTIQPYTYLTFLSTKLRRFSRKNYYEGLGVWGNFLTSIDDEYKLTVIFNQFSDDPFIWFKWVFYLNQIYKNIYTLIYNLLLTQYLISISFLYFYIKEI